VDSNAWLPGLADSLSVSAVADPTPITTRLVTAADQPGRGVVFISGKVHTKVMWAELHDDARRVAASLQERGIQPGDHVAILGPTSRQLITAIQACWLAGAASMVLPLPMRMGSIEDFVTQTRNRIIHGDAQLLLVDDALAGFYTVSPDDPPLVPLGDLFGGPDNVKVPDPDPERLVILQYTSGSTSEPKGVMIPDRVLGSNLDALALAAGVTVEDSVVVSWLPLYHDMGLVGTLSTPMTMGVDLVQAAPQDFLAHPGNWMQWLSDYKGTLTAGPNFSWVLATRALKRMAGLDLSRMSLALSGAEPVDPNAVEAFVAESARFGFPSGAVFPAFGMAEVAIAGTFPPLGRGMVCDSVDRVRLERERIAVPRTLTPDDLDESVVRRIPYLGFPVQGLEIRVCDPETGAVLADRHVGELQIRGTSVTPGYYKREEATATLLRDGWLHTGDLAYMVDGEMIMCGRIKDVIIVGGRNVFPEDIERAVGVLEGVRAGNVIAFGVDGYKGKETVVVVAETKAEFRELAGIRDAIHHRAVEVSGLPPRDIMLVKPGTLPKTSSGKLQRSLCKQQYLEERLELA
jgi:fatty-acyl-CoA synthase